MEIATSIQLTQLQLLQKSSSNVKPNLKQRWWFGWAHLPKVLLISMFTKVYKLLIKKHIWKNVSIKDYCHLLPNIIRMEMICFGLMWPKRITQILFNNVWLKKNISFVSRVDNPSNVPQARPIETVWTVLERKIYENNWEAKNIDHLVKRIKQKAKELDQEMLQGMIEDVGKKLRAMWRRGEHRTRFFVLSCFLPSSWRVAG